MMHNTQQAAMVELPELDLDDPDYWLLATEARFHLIEALQLMSQNITMLWADLIRQYRNA